jgi:hypothetical protein
LVLQLSCSAYRIAGSVRSIMGDDALAPTAGQIPFALGQPTIVRIPVPGTNGLCVEFTPRGWLPKGGSTSTLFFQDSLGKKQLRLDYGYNESTKTINYHWNQKGTYASFGISDHAAAGRLGPALYKAAKYFRYAGRVLAVVGIGLECWAVVQAQNRLRRASQAVVGLAGAWVGCKAVGAGGAALGTLVAPGVGTATGGVVGCIVGGYGGYVGGSSLAGGVYDWGEHAMFVPLPRMDSQ